MIEGWEGDEHYILFNREEALEATKRYRLNGTLPGYQIVGLKSWDDFIVRSTGDQLFTVPTVPLIPEYLEPLNAALPTNLQPSEFAGKIKWYVQPIVFGGSAELGNNVIWVDHLTHVDLVCWWNQKYRETANFQLK